MVIRFDSTWEGRRIHMLGLLAAEVVVSHKLGVVVAHTLPPAGAVHKLPPAGEVVSHILALVAAHNIAVLGWVVG